jgi:hypothetical protein
VSSRMCMINAGVGGLPVAGAFPNRYGIGSPPAAM